MTFLSLTAAGGPRRAAMLLALLTGAVLAAGPALAQSSGGGNGGGGGGAGAGGRGGGGGDAIDRFGGGAPVESLRRGRRPRGDIIVIYEDEGAFEEPAFRAPRRRSASPDAKPRAAKPKAAARTRAPRPSGGTALAAADERAIAPGEVLVEFRANAPAGAAAALAQRERLDEIASERFELTGRTLTRYRIRDGRSVADVVRALGADRRVRSAQPNHIYTLSQQPGLAATQYAVAKMRLTEAHGVATGAEVAVAVIDSGVDAGHPALAGAVAESFDGVGGAMKPHAHGTAVAGLLGARAELAGVAPAARILAARAFTGEETGARDGAEGTTWHILRGLDWAAKRQAKVVNMSFAGPRDARIAEFIAAGLAKGAIHVAAAGNAGPTSAPLYPAADPNVIAVTATDADDRLLTVANRGKHLAVAAPGVDVLVATPGGGYGYLSGTSMAAAEVSGAVALMLQIRPGLTLAQARAALTKTARDLGPRGFDPGFGAGAIDAKAALDAVAPRPSAAAGGARDTASARP